jgi:hypothetical protein
MIILGINAFHGDSSAALVRDGVLVAAAEEERFRRVKHWAGFPSQSIAYCLREAGLRLADVEHVAINQDDRAHRLRKFAYVAAHPPGIDLVLNRLRNRRRRRQLPELLAEAFPPTITAELFTMSNTISRIYRPRFTFRPSTRRSLSRSMVLVTSPARHGALGGITKSPLRVAFIFRTLSASSIRL